MPSPPLNASATSDTRQIKIELCQLLDSRQIDSLPRGEPGDRSTPEGGERRGQPAARAALSALRDEIAKSVDARTADWTVTRWLITKQLIAECVRLELAERRP
jgi:hypothetical protein